MTWAGQGGPYGIAARRISSTVGFEWLLYCLKVSWLTLRVLSQQLNGRYSDVTFGPTLAAALASAYFGRARGGLQNQS